MRWHLQQVRITPRACRAVLVLGCLVPSAACAHRPDQTPLEARALVDSLYRSHFKAGQGFSLATLRATRAWFTPTLYALLLHDMDRSPARGQIGYLDADPFTDMQDDADSFAVGRVTRSGDTVIVKVWIVFGPGYELANKAGEVDVALVRLRGRWCIADFVGSGSLAAGLRANPE